MDDMDKDAEEIRHELGMTDQLMRVISNRELLTKLILVVLAGFLGLANILILIGKLFWYLLCFFTYNSIIFKYGLSRYNLLFTLGLDLQAVENFLRLARGAQSKEDFLTRLREFDQKYNTCNLDLSMDTLLLQWTHSPIFLDQILKVLTVSNHQYNKLLRIHSLIQLKSK